MKLPEFQLPLSNSFFNGGKDQQNNWLLLPLSHLKQRTFHMKIGLTLTIKKSLRQVRLFYNPIDCLFKREKIDDMNFKDVL